MEKFVEYTNFILAVGIILIWLTLIIAILVTWIFSKYENQKFFKAAQKSLELDDINKSMTGLRNDYEVYKNKRFGFSSNSIVELCQKFDRKLKLENNINYIDKLERIIDKFKDEYRLDDDKIDSVVNKVREKNGSEEARELKEFIIQLMAFNRGVLFEKDRYYKDMIEKMARKKWISNLGYIIGFIGSIASVYGIFF
ncbi:hypothetical protein [Lacrimispora sp.]|uniref:hypothetical protein n=1 Tax=Lacrimispora sp. TaxID=2719234 RepID=UPI0028B16685|nr:hypothetical protein [Lacrimispora sp.]